MITPISNVNEIINNNQQPIKYIILYADKPYATCLKPDSAQIVGRKTTQAVYS